MALGAVWFLLAAVWPPILLLGMLWWVAVAAAAVADIRCLAETRRVSASRSLQSVLSLGVSHQVEIALRNRSRYDFACLVRDEPPLDFETDRLRLPCSLPANGTGSAEYRVTPRRRGDFPFGRLHLRLTTGFGLMCRQLRLEAGQVCKVYPSLAGIRQYELAARKQHLLDVGIRPLRLSSAALEFESLRNYLPGDELRRIDWKATARHNQPITRDYNVERSQHLILCLDLGRTMLSELGALSKVDHAINAASLLAHVACRVGDWVGIYAFAREPAIYLPPRKRQFSRVLDALYRLQAERTESDYHQCFLDVARRVRKRALVVLFTDLWDPDSSARLLRYARLITRRHLVLCPALSDYELYEIVARSPGEPRELYERAVGTALLADRERALSALRKQGAIAFDATPANLSLAVLNRYLTIKSQLRL